MKTINTYKYMTIDTNLVPTINRVDINNPVINDEPEMVIGVLGDKSY